MCERPILSQISLITQIKTDWSNRSAKADAADNSEKGSYHTAGDNAVCYLSAWICAICERQCLFFLFFFLVLSLCV